MAGVDGDPVTVGSASGANAAAGETTTSIVVLGAVGGQRGAVAAATVGCGPVQGPLWLVTRTHQVRTRPWRRWQAAPW